MPRLLVGLGNPTKTYTHTRHNVGRLFIDYIRQETKSSFTKIRQAEIFRLPNFFDSSLDQPLICAQLTSYMNESGPALKWLLEKESIPSSECMVIFDDFALPFGTIRLRSSGSAGGHNGIKSILDALQSDQFDRLRIGIGPLPPHDNFADFVLENFSKSELKKLPALFDAARAGLNVYFDQGSEKAKAALNKHHLEIPS